MEPIAPFVDARRALIDLWPLLTQLWGANQEKLCKTSKEFKALDGLVCRWSPVRNIQSQADGAACRYADKHGNELFRRAVDGQQLNAATKWFYGTLPEEIPSPRRNRTKQFSMEQLLLLEAVDAKAQAPTQSLRMPPSPLTFTCNMPRSLLVLAPIFSSPNDDFVTNFGKMWFNCKSFTHIQLKA